MLFDHFDQVRIVNLPHRADRRAQMRGELRRIGAADDARVAFFEACRFDERGTFESVGARGCYHSHLAILEDAAAKGHSVLILEDDADFTPPARDTMLPAGWQIFYGGYHAAQPDDLHNSDIAGSHVMGFSADIVPVMVAYLRGLLELDDHPPVDGAYVWFRRAHPAVVTHFAVPPIAVQRPSRTDIASLRFFDRWPGLREGVSVARNVKRFAARHPRRALTLGAIGAVAAAAVAVALA